MGRDSREWENRGRNGTRMGRLKAMMGSGNENWDVFVKLERIWRCLDYGCLWTYSSDMVKELLNHTPQIDLNSLDCICETSIRNGAGFPNRNYIAYWRSEDGKMEQASRPVRQMCII